MSQHRHLGHRHFHAVQARDFWDDIANALTGNDDSSDSSDSSGQTIVKTVYMTQVPSGYTGPLTTRTAGAEDVTTTTSSKKTTATTTSSETKKTSTTAKETTSTTANVKAQETSTSSKTTAKTTSTSDSQSLIEATSVTESVTALTLDNTTTSTESATSSVQLAAASTTSGSASSSSTASADSSTSGGTSAAAKAGIAIGVLGGLFAVFLIVFFLFRRRQKQQEQKRLEDDEKIHGPFGDHADINRSPSAAPRLSLRPVTQLLSSGIAASGLYQSHSQRQLQLQQDQQQYPDRRASRGATIAMQSQSPVARYPAATANAWERPMTASGNGNQQHNPFGDNAARPETPTQQQQSQGFPGSPNSDSPRSLSGPTVTGSSPTTMAAAVVAAGAAGAAGGASLARKTSNRRDGPKALDLTIAPAPPTTTFGNLDTVPGSPAGTEFSFTSMSSSQVAAAAAAAHSANITPSASAAAIAAAGGPAVSTVHRVQLDFKPTLEDELELHTGQLVRLLHEYDDGWSLVIRLDRSQQGVVPRTCLSTRPVKPRPPPGAGRPGPPINPSRPKGPMRPNSNGHRGPGGPMMGGRPQSRPQSPYGGPPRPQGQPQSPFNGTQPRPGSSASYRPQSPGMRNQAPYPSSSNGSSSRSNTMTSSSSIPIPSQEAQRAAQIGRKPVPGQAY